MIAELTKEELDKEHRAKMDMVAINFKSKQEDRKFELEKFKAELSVPQRWKAVSEIFKYIFVYPITIVCISILLLCKRDVKHLTPIIKG